ncbi:MAG: hypothetical protein NC209_01220 [Alistipes sp.]|nr:hypothetical protein [Alistipes senegalensis]MCM1249754.1 hypothetical protein [Alistipes sp.]
MNRRIKIAIVAALVLTACQELPNYLSGDALLAQVGRKELRQHDVQAVVPKGLVGDDSAAFIGVYIDRWVRKQLKLQEAEVLFSASGENIDKMVEEYRQALLIRKLEQYYIDIGVDTTCTDDEIAAYYNTHKSDFRLDRSIVKGRIVRFNEGFRQSRRLKELMGSESEADQRDFKALCTKNEFTINDFSDRWTDFPDFLSYLPALQSQNYNSILASTSVQEMRDSHSHYFFRIEAVRREGEPIPLERLRPTIRRILLNQRQGETIRRHEEELYSRSVENGDVKIPGREKSEAQEEMNND